MIRLVALTVYILILVLVVSVVAFGDSENESLTFVPIIVQSEREQSNAGDPVLWLAVVELSQHCLWWDELIDCAEYPYSAQLDQADCDKASSIALSICIFAGAPMPGWTWLTVPYPTGFTP